ncbi:MAG: hypothetical protein P4L62_02515 [Candidatus Pacebacteria bacterium]|nr:hypothetical protein [Candidatus Paceibacterota bacterium]MDR3583207.1 hypothetical protein [Candidatus Paceibacterota bacterium]
METTNSPRSLSPAEITQMGERIYFDELKEDLERTSRGQFLVLDVQTKQYALNSDRLVAVEEAQKKFGSKLFFIVQVGNLEKPAVNYKKVNYGWNF